MTETKPSLAVRRALRCVSTAARNKRQAQRNVLTALRRYHKTIDRLDMAIMQYAAKQEDK